MSMPRGLTEWLAAALTVLIQALLLDVVVEALARGAAGRWWVAAIIGGYFAVVVALWQRVPRTTRWFGWTDRAAASVLVALAMLAITAWIPEERTTGLTVAGQSLSTVFTMATALAVAWSTVLLLRALRPAAWWTRVAVGALATYGLVAFALGVQSGTPYPALLGGNSFWTRLPIWAQGAVLGAMVLVPAALVVTLVALARTVQRGRSGFQQALALALSVSIAWPATGLQSGSLTRSERVTTALQGSDRQPSTEELREPLVTANQELAASFGFTASADTSLDGLQRSLDSALTSMEEADAALPRETFDVAAVVRKIGTDPVKLFEWVRDNTYFVPYRGLLRGASGVLMDRRGNSLDRAMLLVELLRTAGLDPRLAHATLSRAQAEAIARNARPFSGRRASRRPADDTRAPRDGVDGFAQAHNLDPVRLRAAVTHVSAASDETARRFERRIVSQATEIAAMVVANPEASRATSGADIEAAEDHWWVRAPQADTWIDLDPTAPDAGPGKLVAEPAEILASSDVPPELRHEVSIRIVVEQWHAGRLLESTPLEHVLRPQELFGQRIVLRNRPLKWPDTMAANSRPGRGELEAALVVQKEWVPVLTVGETTVIQRSVTETGTLNDRPGTAAAGASPEPPAAGLLGGLDGGADDAQASADDQLTAEWIEYEIRTPGLAPRRVRRDVFDLLGPATRSHGGGETPHLSRAQVLERAMALLGETDILLLPCQPSPDFTRHVAYRTLLAQRKSMTALLQGSAGSRAELESAGTLDWSSGPLYGLAFARAAWSPVRDDVYVDRTNVFTYRRGLRLNERGDLVSIKSLDIVANDVAVRPGSGRIPFDVRLTQGVADTASEAMVVGGCGGCGPAANVSELWASTSGKDWILVHASGNPGWKELGLAADARSRVEADLHAGYMVLAPPRDSAAATAGRGWWRVDPKTGTTVGIGESGEGQALAEYPRTVVVLSGAAGVVTFGSCGGFNSGVNGAKRLGCFVCAAFASWVFMTSMYVGPAVAVSDAVQQIFGLFACGFLSWDPLGLGNK